jgi:hypothetical protein
MYGAICSTCSSGSDETSQRVWVGLGLPGQHLHLARVVDAQLLVARQGARPRLGVLLRPVVVGVEADLHLDHAVHARHVAAGLLGALGEARQERLGVQLLALAAGADEAVADAPGEAGGGRSGGGDVDRHRVLRPVVDGRLVGLEELAIEGDEVLGPQLLDQRDRLAQPGEALALLGPVDSDRDLDDRLDADAG